MTMPTWWNQLIFISDELAAEDQKNIEEWQPSKSQPVDQYGFATAENWMEPKDVEVSLMSRLSHLGQAFARHSKDLTTFQRQRFLAILDRVLASGSLEDPEPIAVTEFLDALQNASESAQADTAKEGAWKRYAGFNLQSIWEELGPASQQYLLGRDKFWGVDSPTWMRLTHEK